ncbi:hypothetical protein HTG_07105 [Natrinema mahii]|nr:hypothetical protein HTG_07105 [Natrinema mahii]
MRWSVEQVLVLRMICSLLLLFVAIVGFVGALWAVFVGFFLFARTSLSTAMLLSTVPTILLLLWIIVLECRGTREIEQAATATPVTVEEYPELYATVNRVSSIFGMPAPTISISDSLAPEAMVIGVRPTNSRLILSEGLLDTLDAAELEAVIAHELAHVKNRDATVMTIVSVPMILSAGIAARTRDLARHRVPVAIILGAVGRAVVPVTKAIITVCSRTRELAADKAAVEVLGSGAPLASALRTLDQQIQETPSQDLRNARAVSSLSILPFESYNREELLDYWYEGDTKPFFWSIRRPLLRFESRLFRTHPPTEKRIKMISNYESRNRLSKR